MYAPRTSQEKSGLEGALKASLRDWSGAEMNFFGGAEGEDVMRKWLRYVMKEIDVVMKNAPGLGTL